MVGGPVAPSLCTCLPSAARVSCGNPVQSRPVLQPGRGVHELLPQLHRFGRVSLHSTGSTFALRVRVSRPVARPPRYRSIASFHEHYPGVYIAAHSPYERSFPGSKELDGSRAGIALDGETPGALASTPSANSHRERWRELAPRNRGNRRRVLPTARCQVQQEAARAHPGRCGESQMASSTERVARKAQRRRRRTRPRGGCITAEYDTRPGGRR